VEAGRKGLVEALVQEMPWYISAAVRFQIAVADQLGMPLADVHAVGALLEFGPIGVRQLASVMGTTSSAATRMADRLERAGYVRRVPDPADRRRVVLQVVPERVVEITRYYESMGDQWRRQLDGCSDGELRFLLEFLRHGREGTHVETAHLRATGRQHGTRRRSSPDAGIRANPE
jgi:DNA-binding MarR family transcriptional regulator